MSAGESRDERCVRMLTAHDGAIRRLAASYERDPSRRQDLVQDIWLAVWQALPRFRDDCSERTFVFRIAHNRAWGWLAGVTLTAVAALVTGGWWLARDRARLEALRRDLAG